ncbi:hypothetical protein CL630_01625 [bacterium]|nr:hypothetical protein [bacterium]|tara:strand:- start:17237 stop:17503 length:267 start_codon:yes stop_codon:yes gene_type:complete
MNAQKVNYNFNKRQCIRSLKQNGFINKSKRRKHFKFYPPDHIKEKIEAQKPQFIMVPNHRELKVQHLIIKELREMGGEELVKSFLEKI